MLINYFSQNEDQVEIFIASLREKPNFFILNRIKERKDEIWVKVFFLFLKN